MTHVLAHALTDAMLAFLLQGTLIGLAVALARTALGPDRPHSRHAVGVAGLLAMAVVFLTTFAVNVLSVPTTSGPAPVGPLRDTPWLALAWLAGEGVLCGRALLGWWTLLHWRRRASAAVPAEWLDAAERLSGRLRLKRPVSVRLSDRIDVPLVSGLLRPVVLLPAGLGRHLRAAEVEALLAHELSHLVRGDLWILTLQRVIETLLFFHPAVWWLSARVTTDRELCTDDLAVTTVGDRLTYARALARLEATRASTFTPALASSGGNLMSRIERLVAGAGAPHPRGRRPSVGRALVGSAVVGTLVLTSWLATPLAGDAGISWMPERVARYMPFFEAAGAEHGVDPELLAIMALVESDGNPEARSRLGAVGLMQVMPETAQMIAKERGMEISERQLADPWTNIDMAAWFVARQQRRFSSKNPDVQVALIAAAYNGGGARLRQHISEGVPLSKETERYRERVLWLWKQRDQKDSPLSK